MDISKLRAWRAHRQGLDGTLLGKSPREALLQSGWARSVGGANPYLGIHARTGASRPEMDQAVADLQIHEIPAARGCTYVVPSDHFALALKVGQGFGEEAEIATAVKYLGVTEAEIERLSASVLQALGSDQLDPKQMRSALGDEVRSLGDEGKKRGVNSTLPLALGRLQAQGRIRRVPIAGRLDQQRYAYTVWSLEPYAGTREEAFLELAGLFFSWAGPALASDFQSFAGLGVRAAKEVLEGLALVPMEPGSDLLMHPEDADALSSFTPSKEPSYALLGSIDSLMHLRRDLTALLAPEDLDSPLLAKSRGAGSTLLEVDDHVIVDRGQIIGLWQFDPEAGEIVWQCFGSATDALREAVAAQEKWVREELGDARSFSLDSPTSRKPRLERLRTARS